MLNAILIKTINGQAMQRVTFLYLKVKFDEMTPTIWEAFSVIFFGVWKKRALEEKKTTRTEAKNSEKLAMQSVQEKTATLEMYSKVWMLE